MVSPPDLNDPHGAGQVLHAGPTPAEASGVLILLHGRGASAHGMLDLFDALGVEKLAALAPQAASNSWYPQSFLAPIEANQPYLDSALRRVKSLVDDMVEAGIPTERIALLGFSQGACLTCEFVVRNPKKYGAVMALTGGVIGPPGVVRNFSGLLDGTPVFLAAGDPDVHVPFSRVKETSDVMTSMGAEVELRRYQGMPHTINDDELMACRTLLQTLVDSVAPRK